MALDDEAVIRFLSLTYPGPVSTRALWQWAGGEAGQIEYHRDPRQQWQQLWDLARKKAMIPPAALLREALFDRPGNPDLLGLLAAWVDDAFPQGSHAATVFAAQLDRLAPEFDLKRLWPLLAGFPDGGELETFAALCGSLQGGLASSDAPDTSSSGSESNPQPEPQAGGEEDIAPVVPVPRKVLEAQLQQLITVSHVPAPEDLAVSILFLRDTLPGIINDPVLPGWDQVCRDIGVLLDVEKWDAAILEEKIPPLLAQLSQRVSEKEKELVQAAAAAMDKQLVCLLALLGENPPPDVEKIANACIRALWGTTT